MSVAELKQQIIGLNPDDRRELAALIMHLNRKDSPEVLDELDRRLDSISEKKFTKDDFREAHRKLSEQGK